MFTRTTGIGNDKRACNDQLGRSSLKAGEAVDVAGNTEVKVLLDFRTAKAGMYFLATVRGSDNGGWYYPLKSKYGIYSIRFGYVISFVGR